MAEHSINREAALLLSRIEDLAEQCRNRDVPVFMGFLDTAQQTLAADKLKHTGACFAFWGGYDDAERVFVGIFPDAEDRTLYPFCCIEFCWRQEDTLSHRDFLGSLMALQIKRESLGDIMVEPGRARVFLTEHAARLVENEIIKIGRVGVTVAKASMENIRFTKSFAAVTGTVSSLRLDCIVAFLANLSRTEATKLITSGLVAINGFAQLSVDKGIATGDKISIRGVGKFIFDGQDGVSRKDKLRLNFKKYQ